MNNVNRIKQDNLCVQCGVCSVSCPQKCIFLKKDGFNFFPEISSDCVNCGICLDVCPSTKLFDFEMSEDLEQIISGKVLGVFSVKAKDESILENATSGGFITKVVQELLKKGMYDFAFLLKGYDYDVQLETQIFDKNSDFSQSQKSRYLTVSHAQTCEYMMRHPDKKIIIVATGCALNGILNFINLKKLKRENYLLMGLFCDKTMNYGVVEYFRQHPVSIGKNISQLFFRDKRAGGWPGNVRIEYDDGSFVDLPNTSRMEVKDYFILERCLYCLDKLNRNADISIGDNYIRKSMDSEGANSIIIRSLLGQRVFNEVRECFFVEENTLEDLILSQCIRDKKLNQKFAKFKKFGINGENNDFLSFYQEALRKREIVQQEDLYNSIQKDLSLQKQKNLTKVKKVKFCGFTVFKKKEKKGSICYSVLGIPFKLKKKS